MSDHDNQTTERDFEIRTLERTDRDWVARFLDEHSGSTRLVSRGNSYYGHLLPGFIAERNVASEDDQETEDADAKVERVGLMLYNIENFDCEILALLTEDDNIAIKKVMVAALREALAETAIQRVWLITTNDNLPALRFWQQHEFVLKALHVNSVQEARRLKPQIPIIGHEGIPVRDEIELEWLRS